VDEIEQLRSQLIDARAAADSLRSLVQERTTERDTAVAERSAAVSERDASRAEVESVRGVAAAAVGKYREAVIAGDTALGGVSDLIAGESIEAVDAAVERAKGIVGRVREQMEQANQGRGVPTGGTTRQPLDTAAMSAGEKIRYGVAQAAGG
jgi:hypothetical protein